MEKSLALKRNNCLTTSLQPDTIASMEIDRHYLNKSRNKLSNPSDIEVYALEESNVLAEFAREFPPPKDLQRLDIGDLMFEEEISNLNILFAEGIPRHLVDRLDSAINKKVPGYNAVRARKSSVDYYMNEIASRGRKL